jgi:hypothetical protein
MGEREESGQKLRIRNRRAFELSACCDLVREGMKSNPRVKRQTAIQCQMELPNGLDCERRAKLSHSWRQFTALDLLVLFHQGKRTTKKPLFTAVSCHRSCWSGGTGLDSAIGRQVLVLLRQGKRTL